ncbi:MAG: cytidine deaminase [Planctomycetes bacterium]|nr:cytidine deaminase [Planctomycetota bacterium]
MLALSAVVFRWPQLEPACVWATFLLILLYRFAVWSIYRQDSVPILRVATTDGDHSELISLAASIRMNASAKHSGYKVGAAVRGLSGKTYVGCNVEFDNYSNTIHAEEAALAAAVAGGETGVYAIAVVTGSSELAWPCGMCLQSLFELGGRDLLVIASNGNTSEVKRVGDLLPSGFRIG